MILIADGGSTKTSWCLINDRGEKKAFKTEGYNPFYVDSSYIACSLTLALPADIDSSLIKQINYYGAGVHNAEKAAVVKNAFKEVFINSEIWIGHDMLAAARALLGHKPGFVAILGTGTNTCIFNGDEITASIESGGFIIGDEGSGGHIGKQLLIDYVRGYMPPVLHAKFNSKYNMGADEILNRIYSQPFANRFVASFSEFIGENIHHEYCYDLIKESFNAFFENLVSHYPNYKLYTFNCIGSVGYNLKSILEETALEFGMKTGIVISSPMEGLINYHARQINLIY
jgi:glucosamine kinase